jgi:hypothetical protein
MMTTCVWCLKQSLIAPPSLVSIGGACRQISQIWPTGGDGELILGIIDVNIWSMVCTKYDITTGIGWGTSVYKDVDLEPLQHGTIDLSEIITWLNTSTRCPPTCWYWRSPWDMIRWAYQVRTPSSAIHNEKFLFPSPRP